MLVPSPRWAMPRVEKTGQDEGDQNLSARWGLSLSDGAGSSVSSGDRFNSGKS